MEMLFHLRLGRQNELPNFMDSRIYLDFAKQGLTWFLNPLVRRSLSVIQCFKIQEKFEWIVFEEDSNQIEILKVIS